MPQGAYHVETSEHETLEEWRPMVGFEGRYSVSDQGRVRAEARLQARRNGRPLNRRARVLRLALRGDGYEVSLDGADHVRVGHAVLEAFVGSRPNGAICRYLNGARTDPRLVNLRWALPQEEGAEEGEQWQDVPGWEEFYAVSDRGRVLSKEWTSIRCGSPYLHLPHLMLLGCDDFGYPYVRLAKGGRHLRYRVHELVLLAFVGPRPGGQVCRHLDGNPNNNTLCNLAYGTHAENMADAKRHGTIRRGEHNSQAKLTARQVRAIRKARDKGQTQRAVAARFGVSQSTVSHIWARKVWRHIT